MLVAVLAGVVTGLALGALGGGGAIVTVPVLVYGLGQSAHEATTSSLVIVGVSAVVAAVAHARAHRVRWGQGLAFGLLGTAGTAAGSQLAAYIDATVLLVAFAALLLVVSALMWRRSVREGAGAGEPHERAAPAIVTLRPAVHCDCFAALKVLLTATGVGLLTGFFGVGGGFAVVPALVVALGFPMPVAVGTSLLVVTINSATALAARLATGVSLDWRVIAVFTTTAIVGSLLGTRVAAHASPRTLTKVFAGSLVVIAVYIGVRSGLTLLA
jgi:hypothetical protein